MKTGIWIVGALSVLMAGCPGAGGIYGGGTDGGNSNTSAPPQGLTNLDPIDFASDVPLGEDPASITRGGGTVTFSGGVAGTLGIPPLYFSDAFAWDLSAGGTSTITFADLEVRRVQLYFAHQGDAGATLTAEDADGTSLGTIESFSSASLGDVDAVFEIDGGDAAIARLVIEVPDGAVAAIDHVILAVPESP